MLPEPETEKLVEIALFRLKAQAVLAGRLSEMLRTVAAEVRERGKVHPVGYLGERQTFIVQIVFQYWYRVTVDVRGDAVACHPFDGGREIFGRYMQTVGIVAHITLRTTDARGEQGHQLFHDVGCAVGMRLGGFSFGMGLEDVVHHRQAKTAHQFMIELQMAVTHTVTKTMEVIKQMLCLLI